MKRSELLIKLQRFYTQKHVMVEGGYITGNQFMDEVLTLVEELGMRPPIWDNYNPSDSERYCSGDNDWTFQRTDPDGKRIWSLKCDSWENE